MLNEIIRNVGYENIKNTIKNDITKMGNSIYIRIPINEDINETNDILTVKPEVKSKKDIETDKKGLIGWFKEKELYTKYLSSDKAVSNQCKKFNKVIQSCHQYSIMFNSATVMKKIKNEKYTETKEELVNSFILEYLGIFKAKELFEYYEKVIPYIIKYFDIEDETEYKNAVKIFLDVPIEQYIENYNKYINDNIFDKGTQVKVKDQLVGRLSMFYTLNSKKPLLGHMIYNTNEIDLIERQEAIKLYDLNRYIYIKYRETLTNKDGVGSITYKSISKNDKAIINDYNINPYMTYVDLGSHIYIKNHMSIYKWNESVIKTYRQLRGGLLNGLLEGKISKKNDKKDKNSKSDKDIKKEKCEINFHYNTFEALYKQKILELDMNNMGVFKTTFKNMMTLIHRIFSHDKDDFKISKIINFEISMNDYLFNTNKGVELNNMIENIKEKIKLNETYVIESNEEFYFLIGQGAKYLKQKTKTNKEHKTNKLLFEYLNVKLTAQLIEILKRDKTKLGYDDRFNSRMDNVMASVICYYSGNKNRLLRVDTTVLQWGLYYCDNIFYTKKEKDVIVAERKEETLDISFDINENEEINESEDN